MLENLKSLANIYPMSGRRMKKERQIFVTDNRID